MNELCCETHKELEPWCEIEHCCPSTVSSLGEPIHSFPLLIPLSVFLLCSRTVEVHGIESPDVSLEKYGQAIFKLFSCSEKKD
jgi:hypothetical protein